MTKLFLAFLMIGLAPSAFAKSSSPFIANYSAAGTYNSVQGSGVSLGIDLGFMLDENWSMGIAAHFSFGSKPERDREYGTGPFVGVAYPLGGDVFVAHAREDLDYVNNRRPILEDPGFNERTGMLSLTSVGITTHFNDHFAIVIGYIVTIGISNSALGDGRSGPSIGLIFGL